MLRMAMYAKNVALYCAPTPDDRDTWLPSMQHVAFGGTVFGKFDFDVAGHYSRPAVFQLIVNETPMPAVVTKTKEGMSRHGA